MYRVVRFHGHVGVGGGVHEVHEAAAVRADDHARAAEEGRAAAEAKLRVSEAALAEVRHSTILVDHLDR